MNNDSSGRGDRSWCSRQINTSPSPKGVHNQLSGPCECVTLPDKRDFADVTGLRIWKRGEGALDDQCGPSVITVSLKESKEMWRQKQSQRELGRCYAGFEDGGRGHKPRDAGGLWKLQEAAEPSSP